MNKKTKIILIIIGIGLIIYPILSNVIYKITQTTAITNYDAQIVTMNEEEKEEIKEEYKKYNEEILENASSEVDLLKVGEIIGYISIPKLDINLGIYEGTSKDVLQQGVGHLKNSSIPGEKSTHCVLAGHSGLAKATLFDDIDKLVNGDIFSITILDNTYYYEVDQIKTVEKEDTKDLKIIKNKEYVTLVTCVPRYINSHRLLVRGKRVKDNRQNYEIEENITTEEQKVETNNINQFVIISLIIVNFFLLLIYLSIVLRKKP